MNNKIKDFIKDQFEKLKDLPARERNKQIIQDVKKKFKEVIDGGDIYEICSRIDRMKEKIQEVNDSIDEKKPYEVLDWHYIFHRKDEAPFKFSVEEIDAMFVDFSKHGNNLTGEEMIQKYKLKPEAWQCIKNRLRLYKASNVISPFTAENTPEEELDGKIEYAISSHIDSIKDKMVKTHEKKFKEEAKKAFKVLGNIEYFLDNLRTYIEEYEPVKFDYVKEPPLNNDRLDIAFADIHFGKGGTKDIIARFDEIYNYLIARPESNINIICLGDLWESFAPGGMHGDQEKHMERHGFELVMFIVKTFEKFLTWLDKKWKKVTFRGIGWNHDRFWVKHDQDIERTAALVIYEMIKRGLSRLDIEINYFIDKINIFQIWRLNYCIHHWDDGFDKRRVEDILWKNGNNWLYNIVMHWDKHSGKFQETKNGTMIQVPALAGRWEYDTRLDLHSEAWFVVIEENKFWTADIQFRRLK